MNSQKLKKTNKNEKFLIDYNKLINGKHNVNDVASLLKNWIDATYDKDFLSAAQEKADNFVQALGMINDYLSKMVIKNENKTTALEVLTNKKMGTLVNYCAKITENIKLECITAMHDSNLLSLHKEYSDKLKECIDGKSSAKNAIEEIEKLNGFATRMLYVVDGKCYNHHKMDYLKYESLSNALSNEHSERKAAYEKVTRSRNVYGTFKEYSYNFDKFLSKKDASRHNETEKNMNNNVSVR